MTESESSEALNRARALQSQTTSDLETLRGLALDGKFVDPLEFSKLKSNDELNALRVASSQADHDAAAAIASERRRNEWCDAVKPTLDAANAECAIAADKLSDAARQLVSSVKIREQLVDKLYGEASGIGTSERVSTNAPGVRVDGLLLRHLGPRLLAECQPSISAILRSANEPGMADNFRINHGGRAGIPRPDKDKS